MNVFIKIKKAFFCFLFISLIASCSILENEKTLSSVKSSQGKLNKTKCPKAKIPYETAKYISNNKYLLKVKSVEMSCKSIFDKESQKLNFIIETKAKLIFKFNKKTNRNDLVLPHLFIAIVDIKKENVLVKMFSNIDIEKKESQMLVNVNKFKFKYKNYNDLAMYFGIQ